MDTDNNLHFKSILSEWTDFCRQWDKGGLCLHRGRGEGMVCVLKVREGFTPSFHITLHTEGKAERAGQQERLVSEEADRDGGGKSKTGCGRRWKQTTRQAKQVTERQKESHGGGRRKEYSDFGCYQLINVGFLDRLLWQTSQLLL